MGNKIGFFVTNCKVLRFERFATRDIFTDDVLRNFDKKGELLEIDLAFVFENFGNTCKITTLQIEDLVRVKAMEGVKELLFKEPEKKEYSDADMIKFLEWYENNKNSFIRGWYEKNKNPSKTRVDMVLDFWKNNIKDKLNS